MRLYTFLNENGEVLEQVRAEDHDQAVAQNSGQDGIDYHTDFYSEELED